MHSLSLFALSAPSVRPANETGWDKCCPLYVLTEERGRERHRKCRG